MRSRDIKLEKFYWCVRHRSPCIVKAYALFMVYVVFSDRSNDGWYHCAEIEEIEGIEYK